MSAGVEAVSRPSAASVLADEALRLVGVDARSADAKAREALAAAVVAGDPVAQSVAWRVRGMSARELEDLELAESCLRKAVAIGARTNHECTAQARMSLANVLFERGEPTASKRQARLAIQGLSGAELPRALVQLGLLEQRSGATDKAMESYTAALGPLRRSGDMAWEARLRNNRGILHAYRGNTTAAERDLTRAAELWDELGQEVMAAEVRWNLGFAAGLRGDLVTALQWFETAGDELNALGALRGTRFLDRCQVLLSAGLLDEAREAITSGIAHLLSGDVASDVAEAQLLLSETLLATGDAAGALASAREALVAFEHQRRTRFALLATCAVLRATAADPLAPAWSRAARTAAALRLAGWADAATEVTLLAARRSLEANQGVDAATLALTIQATRRGPVAQRMQAWHTLALVRLGDSDSAGASRALIAGLRVHARHRLTLSALELQVHTAASAGELAAAGLRLAVMSAEPRRVLAWAERWRAGSLLVRPVRPPRDEVLAALLAELRAVVAELQQARLEAEPSSRLERRQRTLERAIADRARAVRADVAQVPLASLQALSDTVADKALVELVQLDGRLHALVVTSDKGTVHDLGPADRVTGELATMRFAHSRLASGGSPRMLAAATDSLAVSAGRLDALILAPLRQRIAERALVIVPTGQMHALAWALLPSVADRPLTVAPSASVWLAARDRRGARRGPVALVAGPGLPGARDEISAVARVYGDDATVFTGEGACVELVTKALDGASYVHLAAHGRFRSDNPLLSSIALFDGDLTVYELETVRSAPAVVVLSACDSGLSSVHPGDELMGLAGALLRIGTRALIASTAPVPDDVARDTMVAFHEALSGGAAPADALLLARKGLDDEAQLRASSFVCFGAG